MDRQEAIAQAIAGDTDAQWARRPEWTHVDVIAFEVTVGRNEFRAKAARVLAC